MDTTEYNTYKQIADAIEYLKQNFRNQPDLFEVTESVNLRPQYFKKLFSEWAGVSHKKFLQFLTVEYAKSILTENSTLSDVAMDAGFSRTESLPNLSVKIESMTPDEYKNSGKGLTIEYSFFGCVFGNLIIASTLKGICHIAFIESERDALKYLKCSFPLAGFVNIQNPLHISALSYFNPDCSELPELKLHLKGTAFQLKVWSTLLNVPSGKLYSYNQIASKINSPGASRAVGSAVGYNPVAFIIPCHRIIQSSGVTGHYMWGPTRKSALIGWEAARKQSPIL